jgi:hypothetical protein
VNQSTIILSGSIVADPAPGGTDKAVCTFTLSFAGALGSRSRRRARQRRLPCQRTRTRQTGVLKA